MTKHTSSFDTYVAGTPDPWAYPQHFGKAVLDDNHALHTETVAKWRGLLALCALQIQRADDYALALQEAAPDTATPLGATLLATAPDCGIESGQGLWRAPKVIMAQRGGWPDVTLAFINPLCLVSPARSFDENWPMLGWMARGLCDPLVSAEPPPLTDIAILASWLSVLEGALAAQRDAVCAILHARVSAFREDCLTHLAGMAIQVTAQAAPACSLPPPFAQLFTECRIAAIANPAALAKGQLALDLCANPLPGEKSTLRGVILADAGLAHHYGQDARHILIWGARTLAEVMADGSVLAEIQAEAAAGGWLVITAADVFAENLVRLGKQGTVPSHPENARECLLPLRPIALLLGMQLHDCVSVKLREDGAICTLNLPMADGGTMMLTRAFAESPTAGQGRFIGAVDWDIHAASIWPDFSSPAFDYYAARLLTGQSAGGASVQPSAVLSRDLMLAMMADAERPGDAMAALHKVNAGNPLPNARGRIVSHAIATAAVDETLWRAHIPFEAIGWQTQIGGQAAAFCGLLLLNLPKAIARPEAIDVAVDFGTTNTVACFSDGAPIRFASRLVVPIQSANPAVTCARMHDKRFFYNKFLPLNDRPLPTPSVTISRDVSQLSAVRGLFRNVILFPHIAAQVDNGEARELELLLHDMASSHFNLKWSDNAAGNDATVDYLEQLAQMIAAEAVARGYNPRQLRWHFSVPDALPPRRREHFERMLEDITGAIGRDGPTDAPRRSALAPIMSEGLAAARTMLAGGDVATHKLLTAIIDIGGGTSDIALWDGDDVRWKGSFRLAGQDFFTNCMSARPEILEGIGLGFWGRMLREGLGSGAVRTEALPHVAELLFNGESLSDALTAYWDGFLAGPGGAPLRIAGLTYLGGMAWYLGLVTRGLASDNALHYGRASMPAFALCGRGAGLFQLMHGLAGPTVESDATAALSLFSIAAQLEGEPRPQLFLGRDAKLEVARGMLIDPPRMRHAAARWDKKAGESDAIASFLPAGLSVAFSAGGAMEPWVPMSATGSARRAMHVGFDDFDTFLKALRDSVGIAIDVHPGMAQGAWDRIEHQVLTQLANAQSAPKDTPMVPPFITALRCLLAELVSLEAQALGRIRAAFV
jgi:hypothetical protein